MAVEPAEGMVAVLEEHLARDGIGNVRTVRKRWEDVDPSRDLDGPFDLVIASFSITMDEIGEALLKMDAVAAPGGMVALYWFLDPRSTRSTRPRSGPRSTAPRTSGGPKADMLFLVLVQLGFLPHVDVLAFDRTYRFADLDEALGHFAPRFSAESDEQRSRSAPTSRRSRRPRDGEGIVIRHPSRYAKVWWQKR